MRYPLYILFLFSLLLSQLAWAEYNPATKKDEFILISDDREIAMGRSIDRNVEKQFGFDEDVTLQERVDKIGQKIASVCDRKSIPYHFKVLKGKTDNAFALPGGYIYIFRQLLDKTKSDDEIAAVMAHEVSHVVARHSVKRLQAGYGYTILAILMGTANVPISSPEKINEAFGQLLMAYSRNDELLADRLAVRYMKKAGYKPEAMLAFLDTLKEINRKAPLRQYSDYRTHPYIPDRRRVVKEELYGRMDFDDYINKTDEFRR